MVHIGKKKKFTFANVHTKRNSIIDAKRSNDFIDVNVCLKTSLRQMLEECAQR